MAFNYVVTNVTKPCAMTTKFAEGTEVNITKIVSSGIVEITNGTDLQICSITQLKRIN